MLAIKDKKVNSNNQRDQHGDNSLQRTMIHRKQGRQLSENLRSNNKSYTSYPYHYQNKTLTYGSRNARQNPSNFENSKINHNGYIL